MKTWSILLLCTILAGCAVSPPTQPAERLFNDRLFAGAPPRISADDVFAVSEEMRQFLRTDMAEQMLAKGRQQSLYDALYSKGQLKLEYDSAMTKNSAEAFATRSGNCLSLVIMTAAFAKELGLPVRYQSAVTEEVWGRSGDIQLFIGHVNVTLGRPPSHIATRRDDIDLTIDFLPPPDVRGLRMRAISEETIVAMYMNNRAAELFTEGRLSDAYWWVRAAIGRDPQFSSSYITLGAIYRSHGNPAEAEYVLSAALARDPANTRVMSNLIPVLNDLGRVADARSLARRLQEIEPDPPFSFFNSRNGGLADPRLQGGERPFREGSEPRPLLPRVPFLAGRRVRRPRRVRPGEEGAGDRDGNQRDAPGQGRVRGEARPDQRARHPVAIRQHQRV